MVDLYVVFDLLVCYCGFAASCFALLFVDLLLFVVFIVLVYFMVSVSYCGFGMLCYTTLYGLLRFSGYLLCGCLWFGVV